MMKIMKLKNIVPNNGEEYEYEIPNNAEENRMKNNLMPRDVKEYQTK